MTDKLTEYEPEAIRDSKCDCRTVNDQGGEPRFWPCPVHGD